MAYTPINWQTGDTITAEKMNKMDNGWGVSSTQLFSETVTTTASDFGNMGQLVYTTSETPPESLLITFDGTDYDCARQEMDGTVYYGAPDPSDFSTYPFLILFAGSATFLYTQSAGTYTVAASGSSLNVSTDFSKAVNSCVNSPMLCVSGETTLDEMYEASANGRFLYFMPFGSEGTETYIISAFTPVNVSFIPTNSQITATFTNDIFIVTFSG